MIWGVGGDLFFASIGQISTALKAALAARPNVKRVLLDCAAVNFIDVSGGDELLGLIKELQQTGITVGFVRMRDAVRDGMKRAGIEAFVGPGNFYDRATDGVRAWQQQAGAI
jgi:MFS superfamily sulfate permease-like transporter